MEVQKGRRDVHVYMVAWCIVALRNVSQRYDAGSISAVIIDMLAHWGTLPRNTSISTKDMLLQRKQCKGYHMCSVG
jgi:hypothetical protein